MKYQISRTIGLKKEKHFLTVPDKQIRKPKLFLVVIIMLMAITNSVQASNAAMRIVTLGSALTETAVALGFGNLIVATDVTSEYPAYIKKLPKVSRNRNLSVEGLMQYQPTLILAPEGDIPANILAQLKKAKINVFVVKQEFSIKGAQRFIMTVALALGAREQGIALFTQTRKSLDAVSAQIEKRKGAPLKVLFIYARGAGNMTVAGKGSNMDAIIHLSGGINAVREFTAFKPYSTEALVKANPDVLLLFDFGAQSLGGKASILNMPGVKLTNAGKNTRIIEVDGPLMVNFATRLPEALSDLHQKLYGR